MYNFNALLARLKYIPRWSLMRQSRREDVAQHTTEVIFVAHTLCLLANNMFGKNVSREKVCMCAAYHDVSEILTGDMPTPVKYNNDAIQSAFKNIEKIAVEKLLQTARPQIQQDLSCRLTGSCLTDYEKKILKAADKLCALTKCIEELQSSNSEFSSAFDTINLSLKEMEMPEVDFFMENMLDGYRLCLDELARI